jgi:predicted Zn finger-like uncharacterized protein
MSLAARCPACGTVFRVVQDQLRVSEGWVRCGRCAEVFNAIESLVDLDAQTPVSRPPPRQVADKRMIEERERARQDEDLPTAISPVSTFGPMPTISPPISPPITPPPAARRQVAAKPAALLDMSDPGPASVVDISIDRRDPPAFLRRAERAAHWRRPGVRAGLATLVAIAGLGLVGQAGLVYRDIVAARWPGLQPVLAQACELLGCRIDAPRAIEALAVESSGLVRIEGTSLYRFSVTLRSRTPLALAVPALDLTLTDSQGSVMARRVILPQDLGVLRTTVPGLAELPLQATLSASERPISGYTIEIFYP